MYGGGHLGQNQQYYQPQPQYQQQQRSGQGCGYNGTRDGPYPTQDYGNGRSQYGYAGNGHNDFPPAYAQDEKKRMN